MGGWIRGEPLHGGTWEAEARTELPLHRWEDGERRLQSLKELRAGQRAGHPLCLLAKGFPAPLVSPSASTRPSHCPPAIVPGFLASKEWVRARAPGFSDWSWRYKAQSSPTPSPSPQLAHQASPRNSRPLSSLTLWLQEAPGLLKGQHKADARVCPVISWRQDDPSLWMGKAWVAGAGRGNIQRGALGWLLSASDLPVLCFPEWPLRAKHPTRVITQIPQRREHDWLHFTDGENEARRGPTSSPKLRC